ncbi:MAG: PAS domain S-box protein [Kofleriaceae bacterium]
MSDQDGRDGTYYLRRMIDSAPSNMAYGDRMLRCRYANRAFMVAFGLDPERVIGRSIRDLVGPTMFELNESYMLAALAGKPQSFEREMAGPDGTMRYILATYTPDLLNGNVVGFIVQTTDVTALKDAVASLAAEVERRRNVENHLLEVQHGLAVTLSSIGAGYMTTDAAGRVTRLNKAAERVFGWLEAEARGRSVYEVYQREGRPMDVVALGPVEVMRRDSVTIDSVFDVTAIARDGTRTPIEIKASLTYGEDGEVLGTVFVFRDLTRLAASEAERRRAEERFRLVVEAAPNGMMVADRHGAITLVNRTAEVLLGRSRDELIGQAIDDAVPRPAEEDAPGHGSIKLRRGDGAELALAITRAPIEDDGSSLTSIVDVTERDRYENELHRSNTELEQFAYVASHDLQEPLRMVASYTELLGQRYKGKLDEKADKYIHYAVDGAQRMQRLVADLLAYSRVESQGKQLVPVAMAPVIARVLNMFGSKLRAAGATVEVGPLPTVLADAEQLFLVFQNLIANAVKFRAEAPLVVAIGAMLERDRWRISVKDNGIGVDPQYEPRIFQMFQRLHARGEYEGSGIGLTIVKRIIERHRGRIWLESELGHGATFHFTLLPAADVVPF